MVQHANEDQARPPNACSRAFVGLGLAILLAFPLAATPGAHADSLFSGGSGAVCLAGQDPLTRSIDDADGGSAADYETFLGDDGSPPLVSTGGCGGGSGGGSTPPPPAEPDEDGIPDPAEAVLCGFPDASEVLALLPQEAGRCVDRDYQSPFLGAGSECLECSTDVVFFAENVPLTPAHDVESIPLPPEEIPGIGPINTPPVQEDVATLVAEKDVDPETYCITLTPSGGEDPVFGCIDLGPVGPLTPDLGPIELVNVSSQSAGPTPGVEEGEHGETPPQHAPATSIDFTATIVWVEDRFNERFTSSFAEVWDPVDLDDPSELEWWAENPDKTALELRVVVYFDDEVQEAVTIHVPYVGQAVAASHKSLDSLS